jgi:ribonuclease HII
MSSPALMRRQTRSCTRLAAAAPVRASEGDAAPTAVLDEAAASQRAKRQRKVAAVSDEPEAAVAAAAKQATASKTGRKVKAASEGPSREYERDLWQQGFKRVAGVDEAGRGPLAGRSRCI